MALGVIENGTATSLPSTLGMSAFLEADELNPP
jgi:hypothetical protein